MFRVTSPVALSSHTLQLDEQLQGAVEVIGRVEHDCSLSGQRIVPYSADFGKLVLF